MRMQKGTHRDDLKIHEEKFNDDQGNLLTRGQTIENVPIEKTEPVILKAGQMSLHHPRIAHGSGINKSNKRRVGFVIQSYIGTNVEQVIGKVYVQQARGEDLFNYHKHTKRPVNTMEKENIDIRNKANEALSKTVTSQFFFFNIIANMHPVKPLPIIKAFFIILRI